MSGGRPAVDKRRLIIENATVAGESDGASRLSPRLNVDLAVVGVSLVETAGTAEASRRFLL